MLDDMIGRDEIETTELLIRSHIRRTPTIQTDAGDFGMAPNPLTFKLESFQHSGSFKARGAFTNLLTRYVPDAGVVAASGGNHGAAVAYAAMRLGVPAKIFVPTVSSPAKIERIQSYAADLVIGGDSYADALVASEKWVEDSGALPVHAFDQRETLLGQGTIGLEFEKQSPDIDTLLVAVGGGGLIAGIAAWYASRDHFSVDGTLKAWASMKSFRPKGEDDGDGGSGRNAERAPTLSRALAGKASGRINVVGVEPECSNPFTRSRRGDAR